MLVATHLLKYVDYFLIKTLSGRITGKTRACLSEGGTAHKRWMTLLQMTLLCWLWFAQWQKKKHINLSHVMSKVCKAWTRPTAPAKVNRKGKYLANSPPEWRMAGCNSRWGKHPYQLGIQMLLLFLTLKYMYCIIQLANPVTELKWNENAGKAEH